MLLGADINLSATVWSAADGIRKLIFRCKGGMVRSHPVLTKKILTVSEEDIRPPEKTTSDH